jgi:hypothetical protein
MWFLYKKVVLTKDNLIKRRCVGVQEVCRGVGRAPFLLDVNLLNLYDKLCISLLICLLPQISKIYLEIG